LPVGFDITLLHQTVGLSVMSYCRAIESQEIGFVVTSRGRAIDWLKIEEQFVFWKMALLPSHTGTVATSSRTCSLYVTWTCTDASSMSHILVLVRNQGGSRQRLSPDTAAWDHRRRKLRLHCIRRDLG
jgi:hypothetical protein